MPTETRAKTAEKMKIVTIDGPAASGKTSVSRELARRLGWKWVSTGAFYRGLAYVADRLKCDISNEEALSELARSNKWSVRMDDDNTKVFLGSEDVTEKIFQEHVGSIASKVSHFPKVREALLEPQRACAKNVPGLVAEGRDCGTVVFPDAQVKIYVTASQESRAERRSKDLGLSVAETHAAQVQRDQQDSTRKAAPLSVPPNAFVIDNTDLSLDQAVSIIEAHVKKNL